MNVELLKADVTHEVKKLKKLLDDFKSVQEEKDFSADSISNFDKAGIGYYLHNFYNGTENIFRLIARFYENDFSRDSWLSDLLKRMLLEVKGYRSSVIDENLYEKLNEFRGFRHKFRNLYNFELNWDKEKELVDSLDLTAGLLFKQLNVFLDKVSD